LTERQFTQELASFGEIEEMVFTDSELRMVSSYVHNARVAGKSGCFGPFPQAEEAMDYSNIAGPVRRTACQFHTLAGFTFEIGLWSSLQS
jgi:hypothetical protein